MEIFRTQPPTKERLSINAEEAAKLLSISSKTLRLLAKENKIPFKRVGNRLLFPVDQLKEWITDCAPVASPGTAVG
jgi:excisionase family DNA binding protein